MSASASLLYLTDVSCSLLVFFFNAPPPTVTYTLSLHDALPISPETGYRLYYPDQVDDRPPSGQNPPAGALIDYYLPSPQVVIEDRKSTRLNSSHRCISYAVFCLKKKKKTNTVIETSIIVDDS